MECNKIRDLLTPYVDGELSEDRKRLVDSHVRDCSSCLSELLFLQRFQRAAADLPRKTAPDGFLEGVHAKLAASPPLVRFLKSLFSFEALKTPAGAAVLVTAVIIVGFLINVRNADRNAVTDSRDSISGTSVLEKSAEEKSKAAPASRVPASAPVYDLVLFMEDRNVLLEKESDDAYRGASRSASDKPADVIQEEMAKKAVKAESPARRDIPAAAETRRTARQAVLTNGGTVISESADSLLVELPSVNLARFTGALRAMDGVSTVTVPTIPKTSSGSMVIRLRFVPGK